LNIFIHFFQIVLKSQHFCDVCMWSGKS
jgi:hypothetical protein